MSYSYFSYPTVIATAVVPHSTCRNSLRSVVNVPDREPEAVMVSKNKLNRRLPPSKDRLKFHLGAHGTSQNHGPALLCTP